MFVLLLLIQISIVSFDYCDSLEPYFDAIDVVIFPAGESSLRTIIVGAGTILGTLRHKKQLIAVVNEQLMGNHQHEIADAMESGHYLIKATPATVIEALKSLPSASLKQ